MAELVYLGRIVGYKPYFIGFSQLDELTHGVDSFYNAGAIIGFFQFKRGYRRSSYFTFYINDNKPHYNQHKTLSDSNKVTGACKYMFPLISTNEEVFKRRGYLLHWTLQFSPDTFDPIAPDNVKHIVRIFDDENWTRSSDMKTGTWKNIFGKSLSEIDQVVNDSVGIQRDWAETALNNLNLPNLETTLEKMQSSEIEIIFKQRSSFCMIFDRTR